MKADALSPGKPFRSAKAEVKQLGYRKTAQARARAHDLAFMDWDFMLRKELRPVRIMLELMKPEINQREQYIQSTIVVLGSARIPAPHIAKANLAAAKRALKAKPNDINLFKQVEIAQRILDKTFYYNEARRLSQIISSNCQRDKKRQFVVVTGGGPGIMEAANRGAKDVHAKSIGLNIILPAEQRPNSYISPELCFHFHYFAMRKMHFLFRARAIVCFPGGYGTLDELFETLTLLQTQKIKRRLPLILVGKEYWTKLINFDYLVEEGMVLKEDVQLVRFVETAQEAWNIIAEHYQLHKKQKNGC